MAESPGAHAKEIRKDDSFRPGNHRAVGEGRPNSNSQVSKKGQQSDGFSVKMATLVGKSFDRGNSIGIA